MLEYNEKPDNIETIKPTEFSVWKIFDYFSDSIINRFNSMMKNLLSGLIILVLNIYFLITNPKYGDAVNWFIFAFAIIGILGEHFFLLPMRKKFGIGNRNNLSLKEKILFNIIIVGILCVFYIAFQSVVLSVMAIFEFFGFFK